ncbi:glutamate--tRNA ligase family protein [Botryobacter ruber]|uniref:glutamate--tRNA ligase family protein n=1 Tax=Botryobacter ruber TaxID=2171629 RepID=UPI000E0BE95B|nr:glutamate--tRNA ligase family protein [Botryobacter ruber]
METDSRHTSLPPLKTRIAPTPSGYLHLGNALSFAITWALARQQQGTVVLRIDDLDNTRFRQEYLQDIFDTLHFMGLDYDEGPRDATDFTQNFSQHLRLPLYNQMLEELAAQHLLYACPCSRSQIAAVSPEGNYPLTCRDKQFPLDLPDATWRIRIPAGTEISFHDLLLGNCTVPLAAEMPDFVVRRKDGIPAYQVASVCDDLLMGINTVVRGEDLLLSTAAQLFLAQQTDATGFLNVRFVHHPIVREESGSKLSKSHASLSIHAMRSQGFTPKALWQQLARTLHWQETEITDAASFLERFRLKDVARMQSK